MICEANVIQITCTKYNAYGILYYLFLRWPKNELERLYCLVPFTKFDTIIFYYHISCYFMLCYLSPVFVKFEFGNTNSFIHSFIRSVVHSFIHSFIRSCHSFIHVGYTWNLFHESPKLHTVNLRQTFQKTPIKLNTKWTMYVILKCKTLSHTLLLKYNSA